MGRWGRGQVAQDAAASEARPGAARFPWGVWSVGPGNAGPGAGLANGAPRSLLGSGAGAGLFNRDLRMRRLHIAARSGRGWVGRYDSALERGGPAHPNPSVAWASPRRRRTHRAKQAAHTGGFAGRQDAQHREESVPSACLCPGERTARSRSQTCQPGQAAPSLGWGHGAKSGSESGNKAVCPEGMRPRDMKKERHLWKKL